MYFLQMLHKMTHNLFVMCMCVHAHTHDKLCWWKSDCNLQETVLPFDYMGPRDQTQVFKLGNEHLCSLNHLASLCLSFLSVATHAFRDSSRTTMSILLFLRQSIPRKWLQDQPRLVKSKLLKGT